MALKSDICSLDLNTMFSNGSVVVNMPEDVSVMEGAIRAAGAKPELQVFDSGDIHLARDLLAKAVLPHPPFLPDGTGRQYGASATPDTMRYLSSLLPLGATWSAFGIGRAEFPMLAQSFLLGGHVRVNSA